MGRYSHAAYILRRGAGRSVGWEWGSPFDRMERAFHWFPRNQGRGSNEGRRCGNIGGAGGQGVQAVAKVRCLGNEELDDAIDWDIEKVSRTACRSNVSQDPERVSAKN